MRLLRAFAWMLAGLLASSAFAQTVTPQPATTIDPIVVEYQLLEDGCFSRIEDTAVEINGFDIEIDVEVEPLFGAQRCTPPVPLVLQQNLGRLPVGDYQVSIVGTIYGNPFGPETTTFSVGASSFGDLAAPIPALAPWGLMLLVLALGGVGFRALRS